MWQPLGHLDQDEFENALLAKLLEEANELLHAPADERNKELADLYEVLEAIQFLWGINPKTVSQLKEKRASERGAFDDKIKLLWVEEQ